MGKLHQKQRVKYIEQKPMTMEDIRRIEHNLARYYRLQYKGQLNLLLDLIIKN